VGQQYPDRLTLHTWLGALVEGEDLTEVDFSIQDKLASMVKQCHTNAEKANKGKVLEIVRPRGYTSGQEVVKEQWDDSIDAVKPFGPDDFCIQWSDWYAGDEPGPGGCADGHRGSLLCDERKNVKFCGPKFSTLNVEQWWTNKYVTHDATPNLGDLHSLENPR
tara:strand:- start:398 stop:886 length:489 start_codon:yes stop_codon:yes gene_type:complete